MLLPNQYICSSILSHLHFLCCQEAVNKHVALLGKQLQERAKFLKMFTEIKFCLSCTSLNYLKYSNKDVMTLENNSKSGQ